MKILFFRTRNRRYLVFAFSSLLVGIVSTMMISKYLLWEYQTDKIFTDHEKIFFLTKQGSPLTKFKETEFRNNDYKEVPQIVEKVSTRFYWEAQLEYENQKYQGTCLVADSTFLDVFDYPLKLGNPKTVLSGANNIVLTADYANLLFGESDPLGKTVTVNTDFTINYIIAGVLETPPGNTTIQFDYIVATHSKPNIQNSIWGRMGLDWVKLSNEQSKGDADIALMNKYMDNESGEVVKLMPLSDAYFNFTFDLMPAKHGDKKHLNLLLVILILVFSLSLFNFFTIYSLFNTNRAKELSVKKILGARTSNLFSAFFIENLILCVFSFGISVLLFYLIYPYFIQLTGKSFVFQWQKDGLMLAVFFSTVLILMLVWANIYSTHISPLLNSKQKSKGKNSFTSFKAVTVFQYSITITLLIVTFSLFRQLNFMQKQDLNFSCDNVISLNFFTEIPYYSVSSGEEYMELYEKQQATLNMLTSELKMSPLIESYSFGTSPFNTYTMSWKKKGAEEYMNGELLTVNTGYENIFKLELTQGRFFSDEMDEDRSKKAVVNEAALRYFGINNIETDRLCNSSWGGEDSPYEIIGVVKDFHNEHLSKAVAPVVIMLFKDIEENWYIRYMPGEEAETLTYLKELHEKISPGEEFSYEFMADELATIYKNDRIQVKLYSILTALALFISLMGISALSLQHAFKRTKETAIRKVNGCTIRRAVFEMMNPYIILVIISFAVSSLAGWYFVSEYLKSFANKLPINYWLFALAGTIALLISVGILFVALINVAKRNPIESVYVE